MAIEVTALNRPVLGPVAKHMLWASLLDEQRKLKPGVRFTPATWRGLNTGERTYQEGEEIPQDLFDQERLRILFDIGHIKVLADTAHATSQAPAQASRPAIELPADLGSLSRKVLADLCTKYGLPIDGPNDLLRQRLAALVA